ncbi:Ty3/Gypsy family RNase HI domain-containing protein, partial [Salmonella enterica subsp. enterica serovar Typhimurium]|nr:Ty3/Gypsy family RNase HI domain-containing protein [Salmonella enterica subsp. enterica serovar Typhimurium]
RRFIPDLATVLEPLTKLARTDQPYAWTEEQETAFQQAKNLLATAPMLHRPDANSQYVVQTDASDTGIGAVLTQTVDGEERVLEFASRVLSSAERNYSVTERECLAVLWAVRKFRPYIEGTRFKVITDHSSLRWLLKLNNPTGRLARWALELQAYPFELEHRSGKLNDVPDALS